MRLKLYFYLLLWALPFVIFSQKIGDPYPGSRKFIVDGVNLHNEEKYEEAIKNYLQVHPSDSLYSTALYELAFANYAAKNYSKSIEYCKKGAQLNDILKRDFLMQHGHALDDMGKPDSAIKIYDKILGEFPYSNKVFYEKGITYTKSKRYKEALDSYLESIQRNPLYSKPHLRIGILAAEGNNTTLAILALEYYCLVESDTKNRLEVLDILEHVCENSYKPSLNLPPNTFNQYDELKELDDIVNSKAAFSKKYKSKVNLNFFFTKQLQVICEHLPEKSYDSDLIVKFYVDFYKKIWEKGHFESLILFGLNTLENKQVKSEIKKNEKSIEEFKSWAFDHINEIRKNQTILVNGSKAPASFWYGTDGNLQAIGNKNKENLKQGKWTYYNDYGYKVAEGNYDNDKREGKWQYYYDNGVLRSIQNLKQDQMEGEYIEYLDNGIMKEQSFYKDNKINGKAIAYNTNGSIGTTMVFVDDKRNGKRINYDAHGNKESEYDEKDNLGTGKYIEYYPSGKKSAEGNIVENALDGTMTYYYENGNIRQKGNLVKGDYVDKWVWYYEDGSILKEGSYVKGKESGEWKYYNKNKKLSFLETYNDGKTVGLAKSFDWYGNPSGEYTYSKSGKLEKYKILDEKGNVILSEKVSGGKISIKRYSTLRKITTEGQYKDNKEEGLWKYYYANGQLESQGNYSAGKKTGLFQEFHKGGGLKSEYFYVNGSLEGFMKNYHKNGKVRTEGYYKNDQANGPFVHYYPNGNIETSEFYIDGKIAGIDVEYAANGKKTDELVYSNGTFKTLCQFDTTGKKISELKFEKDSGPYKYVAVNGKTTLKVDYKNGEFEGKATAYYTNGNIGSLRNYFNGNLHGNALYYYENGKISTKGKFVNGRKDSVWTSYYESGKVSKLETYEKGELNGSYKTFYENGQLEFDRIYLDDDRHGESFYYSPNGNLIIKYFHQFGVMQSYSYQNKDKQFVPNIPVIDESANIVAYYPNGKKSLEYTLSKGNLDGKFIDYYDTGIKMSETNYKLHDNEGAALEYYPSGTLKSEENYFADELSGKCKYYYENGKLNKLITYLHGNRHGLYQEYDNTGKLVATTNYVYGEAIK